jgi:CRP-like cAMP-binding protein
MWELLLQNFAKKGVLLTESETDIVTSQFRYRKYRKNQYILQQGDVARCESYILKGLTRTYLVDDKGQEHVMYFGPEDYWVGDLRSHFFEKPANYNIDCLEETEVLQITKQSIEELCLQVPRMNTFYRHLYRGSIIAHEYRTASILTKSTLERYQEFIQKHPQLEQRIPNLQIASYLGITPQSLSRLRRQYAEQS